MYFYYTGLDFIAWFNSGGLAAELAQLAVMLVLLSLGAYEMIWELKRNTLSLLSAGNLVHSTFSVYFGFVALGLLNFAPSRQVLFLAPALFVVIAHGLNRVCSRVNIILPERVRFLPYVLLAGIGAIAQQYRFEQVRDPTIGVTLSSDFLALVSYDSGHFLAWRLHLPVIDRYSDMGAKPGRYLYVSQTRRFDEFLSHVKDVAPEIGGRILASAPIKAVQGEYSFMGFMPAVPDNRFSYNRPNGLQLVPFEVR